MQNNFINKKLTNSYNKNGFTVNTYKSEMSDKEHTIKNTQIKYDIINIVKDLKTDCKIL